MAASGGAGRTADAAEVFAAEDHAAVSQFVDALVAAVRDGSHRALAARVQGMLPLPAPAARSILALIVWLCLRAHGDAPPPPAFGTALQAFSPPQLRPAYEAIAHVGPLVERLEQCGSSHRTREDLLQAWATEEDDKFAARCRQWFASDEELARSGRASRNAVRAREAYEAVRHRPRPHGLALLTMGDEALLRQPPRFWSEISLDAIDRADERAATVFVVRRFTERHGRGSTCPALQRRCADWLNYHEPASVPSNRRRARVAPFSSVEMRNYLRARNAAAPHAGAGKRSPQRRSSAHRHAHWPRRCLSRLARRRAAPAAVV